MTNLASARIYVALAVALSAVVAAAGHHGGIRRASAAVRPPPDVVLVLTDDQRAGALSRMPQFSRRVRQRGIRFRAAYVPNPSCCPSRTSFYTGTYSHTNGVWKNEGPFGGFAAFDDSSTLATWLDDEGYRTGLFGKYLNGYRDPTIVPEGWDEWFAFL
ncbi:MAG: sulfatase-like hydrolase/transferase, partial [Actinomycetota bacterium]|nr:sulfatase-like hydrolase/transferase [Actinomycetota bacterium]